MEPYPFVTMPSGAVRNFALSRGMHVHSDGRCEGGNSECPTWNEQMSEWLSQLESE